MREDSKEDIRNKCLVELLYSTGIRVSEASNIKLEDIDLNNMTIRIYGKGRKERIAYFGWTLKEKLVKYLKIRQEFLKLEKDNIKIYMPDLKLCTDNAAMIASAGYYNYINGKSDELNLNAIPNLKLN